MFAIIICIVIFFGSLVNLIMDKYFKEQKIIRKALKPFFFIYV